MCELLTWVCPAALSRAKDEHKADQPAGISARRAGYNPLLRKYEQKMPRDVALYLALNAKDKSVVADKHEAVVPDKSVVPNPPTKSKKTSKTPRKSMQAAFKTATAGGTGAGSGAGPGAGVKAQRGEEVERSGQPFISPRIAQVSPSPHHAVWCLSVLLAPPPSLASKGTYFLLFF